MKENKPWYSGQTPIGDAFERLFDTAGNKSVLDIKTKTLIRLTASSVLGCNQCIKKYSKDALMQGISEQEITETVLISALQAAEAQLILSKN
ncbi:MAG: carboxymuconolactone decarboxylase family protein [Elusimicrobia bacterium]|nr:carboxymuconolactone decarboxylase family protein [Candidatus Liberimonas magnetica]